MFVLDELDNILKKLASPNDLNHQSNGLRINLNAVQMIDVDMLNLESKVRYPIDHSLARMFDQKMKLRRTNNLEELVAAMNQTSLNTVFANIMIRLITSRVADLPERPYPTARLIICDQASYDILIKLCRVLLKVKSNKSSYMNNFLYKSPFNVTAIFLLSDIVDILGRERAPITLTSFIPSAGKTITTYNYNLIRKTFPYLKMSDLIILHQSEDQTKQLQLGFFNPKGSKGQQILQFFNHFARSARVIELNFFNKLLGKLHPIYDNVLIIQDPNNDKESKRAFMKMSLPYLSHFAERLVQLAEMCQLSILTLTYRVSEFEGQARVLSKLVSSNLESRKRQENVKNPRATRVIIIDRYSDLVNIMFHADLYGPFFEQEKQIKGLDKYVSKFKLDTIDALDEKLQLQPLTEALSTIIKYAMKWKSPKLNQPEIQSLSSALSRSHSIERHLELVKTIYRCLNEGYLLILRIESSLEGIAKQLKVSITAFTEELQEQIAEKITRVNDAFIQLTKMSGTSIRSLDLLRIACVLLNVTNIFQLIYNQSKSTSVVIKIINDIRASLLSGKEFKKLLKLRQDGDNEEKMDPSTFLSKLNSFDKLSKEHFSLKSTLSLEQIIVGFLNQQLDPTSFPTLTLSNDQNQPSSETNILIAFLGALTPHEISRIKVLEATSNLTKTVLPVIGYIKNYAWGKVGDDSYIARFKKTAKTILADGSLTKLQSNGLDSAESLPLAEIWFGCHPSGPTTIIVGNECINLETFLSKAPEMLGSVDHYYSNKKRLPFLFKILSLATPSSLQAHPDKKLAEILHKKDPKNYPDANHKPELVIALTDLEVLCDFRPASEILTFMKLVPFRRLIGDTNCEKYYAVSLTEDHHQQRLTLKTCFESLMTSSSSIIAKEAKNLLLDLESATKLSKDLLKLITHLDKLYPGDPGVFAPLFLNYLKLVPGQAIYVAPNKMHSYIRGELIECMACSDNVVRVGLTPKFKDVNTLLEMLDYKTVSKTTDVLLPERKISDDPSTVSYVPTQEFKVDKIIITSKLAPCGDYTVPAIISGSFFLVLDGKATARNFFDMKVEHRLALGSSGFIPPKVELKLSNIQGNLVIYRSYC